MLCFSLLALSVVILKLHNLECTRDMCLPFPRKLLTSPAVLGACTLTIFAILSGSGLVPSAVNFRPKNVISFCKNSHFSPFTFKFKAASTDISCSGGSSVSQNKLPQLILGYIYILKYVQSNFIG